MATLMLKEIVNKHSETAINFLWRAIQILGKQGVTFIIFLLCSKILSPQEFGIYNYIFAMIFMFAIFSDFGVSVTASRYTAQYLVSDRNRLQMLPFNAVLIITVLSTFICLVIFASKEHVLYYDYLIYCLPMLFTVPLTSLYDGIYRGFKKFKALSLINFIFGIAFIPVIYFSVTKWGIQGAIIAHNVYYLLLFLLIFCFSFTLKLSARIQVDKALIVKIIKYSLLVGMSDVGLFLYTRADVLVLGHFGMVSEIGYYEISYRLFLILLMPAQLLATVVAPKIAQLFVLDGDKTIIRNNYLRDIKLLFAFGLIISVIFYFLMGPVFSILFGDYDITILYQVMLLFVVLIPFRYFSTYISIGYITPSGNVAISTVAILVFGIVNVLLDFILIQACGFIGVVYATLISQVLFIITRDIFFYSSVIRKFAR